MTDNLATWNALFRTDPAHVKPITGKSYQGNSPKPQYIIMRLTEVFGQVGIGFGWSVVHEAYIEGIPHQDGTERLHECRIRFWAKDPEYAVDSYGCTKALYKAKQGYWVSDEDAAKKSLTDAIVKAASWLGAAGDIFMGRWDDSKYQAELREEFSPANKAKREASQRAPQRPAEPPHDPETGEILDERNPPPAAPETAANTQGDAIRDAWEDAIRDGLPDGYTQRQFDEARAGQLAAKLASYKTTNGLNAGWATYWRALSELEAGAPDLHANLVAVKDQTRKAIETAAPRPMLSKAVGEKIMLAIRLCDSIEKMEAYQDELGESDHAFALDNPKIKDAIDARRRVLAEPIYYGDRVVG